MHQTAGLWLIWKRMWPAPIWATHALMGFCCKRLLIYVEGIIGCPLFPPSLVREPQHPLGRTMCPAKLFLFYSLSCPWALKSPGAGQWNMSSNVSKFLRSLLSKPFIYLFILHSFIHALVQKTSIDHLLWSSDWERSWDKRIRYGPYPIVSWERQKNVNNHNIIWWGSPTMGVSIGCCTDRERVKTQEGVREVSVELVT